MATKTIYQSAYLRLVGLLRERRESLGISQTRLASHLGWPQQRISSVESGARRLLKMLQSVRGNQIKDRH